MTKLLRLINESLIEYEKALVGLNGKIKGKSNLYLESIIKWDLYTGKNVLLTGAAGIIGTKLSKRLAADGANLIPVRY